MKKYETRITALILAGTIAYLPPTTRFELHLVLAMFGAQLALMVMDYIVNVRRRLAAAKENGLLLQDIIISVGLITLVYIGCLGALAWAVYPAIK